MRWKSTLTRLSVLALLAAGGAPVAAQQTGTVRGRVTAVANARPLAGAQVTVAGTNRGAVTSATGEYSITGVPTGSRSVRVQMVGYAPAERTVSVAAGQAASADFALAENVVQLDEVVVTGTAGSARKREIGNSITAITPAQIEKAPVVNTQDIIAARSPGVTVLGNSGQPGAGGTIRLRGVNSITQGNGPLIYVDGVRLYSEGGPASWAARQTTLPLNDIKADDIERVEIVKGAAATTLYGTEASGGVIQIFTKKGRAGKPVWNAELSTGFNRMGNVGPDSDPTGLFLKQCRGPNLVDSEGKAFVDPTCPERGSWSRDGGIQRYGLSVRGGGEGLSYFLSGNFSDENGVIETGFSRDGGFRGNFTFRTSDRVNITMSSSYNKRVTRWVPDGNNASGFLLNVGRGPFNNFKGGKQGECDNVSETCVTNAYILEQKNFNRNDHFITGFTVNYEPFEAMTNRLTVGYDYNAANNDTHYPFGYLRAARGFIWGQDWTHTKLSLDYAGSLRNQIGSSLSSSFSWGGQLFEDRDYYVEGDSYDFAGPGNPTRSSGARTQIFTERRMRVINAGLFLQEMIGWNDRLFLTAGLRVDGNSAFGQDFGLQPYPKLSASYVLSDHDGWPAWWETMKLRAAVGESGKAPGAFDAVRTWDAIAGDEAQPGFTPAQIGNPELGPERTRETEFGFDASLFDGRVGLDVTAFRATTYDALIRVAHPPSLGFLRDQLENVGQLSNRGVEAQLNLGLLATSRLDWRARLNYTSLKSEVVDVDGREIPTGTGTYAREGFPIGTYFGARITNPNDIADPIMAADTALGQVFPTDIIGLGTTLTLSDNLSLDVLGEYQAGASLANWVGYQNARRGIWQPCYAVQDKLRRAAKGDAAALSDVTALERGRCAIDRRVMSDDFWIESSDFFKLRSVSLSYDIPTRFTGGRTTGLTVSGRNLFTWTKYSGTDPEVADTRDSNGSSFSSMSIGRRDYYNLPPVRQFIASLRVSF